MHALLIALAPLMSVPFRSATAELPDDTPIRLAVDTNTGPRRLIELADLRAIWTAYESTLAENLPPGQPSPVSGPPSPVPSALTVSAVELHDQKSERLIMPDLYKLIIYLTGENTQTLTALIPQHLPAPALAETLRHLADQLSPEPQQT